MLNSLHKTISLNFITWAAGQSANKLQIYFTEFIGEVKSENGSSGCHFVLVILAAPTTRFPAVVGKKSYMH